MEKSQEEAGEIVSNFGEITSDFSDRFALNKSIDGQFDLVIKNVQQQDAGIYECDIDWTNQPRAHLTVIYGTKFKLS